MPIHNRYDAFGDLYIEYNVVFPTELTVDFQRSKPVPSLRMFSFFLIFSPAELATAFHGASSQSSGKDEL